MISDPSYGSPFFGHDLGAPYRRTKDGRLVLAWADSDTEGDGSHPSSHSARREYSPDGAGSVLEDIIDEAERDQW